MPSRHAHRAALRRSKEPGVIPPEELPELPALPPDHGWRNPMREYDYVRDEWELYRMGVHASVTLAVVKRIQPGVYTLGKFKGSPKEAFAVAVSAASEKS